MRIALNLLYLIPGQVGGVETYGVALTSALSLIDEANEYFVFLNEESAQVQLPQRPNFHRVDCSVAAVRRSLRYWWEQTVLPKQLRKLRIDVVHSPGYVGPLFSGCPSVVTIPDWTYGALKNHFPIRKRLLLPVPKFFSSQSARVASRVITISSFSKGEIVKHLRVAPEKVTVTHLGPGWASNVASDRRWDEIRESYAIPDRYIVAFGGGSPHKNIARLVSVFKRLANDYPHSLILVGHVPSDVQMSDVGDRVRAMGYIPNGEIKPILEHGDLFVLPSLYEGFGLPALEAQHAGVPLVSSNAASLPEVAGDGALYFDPLSDDSMESAIRRCLDEPALRTTLTNRGRENVKRFTWEKTARETLRVYQEIVGL